MAWLRRIERLAWIAGILLITIWAGARIHSYVLSRRDLRRFEALSRAPAPTRIPPRESPAAPLPGETAAPALPGESTIRTLPGEEEPPDYSLWSPERIRAYEETLQQAALAPLAVLRVPKIALEVAVLDGTDDFTLNRAVGHIAGTALPGQRGNVGIAGHRDGFFRGLKNIACGDVLELETLSGKEVYRVDDIWIVGPDDVQVLDPTPQATLTLVSCYPFYFIGSAPKRYIVRAVRQETEIAQRLPR